MSKPPRTAWFPLALAVYVASTAVAGAEPPDWGAVSGPAPAPARAIGGHALGCLAGGVALPADGPGYQVMRPSRGRFYGHPDLIRFVSELAEAVRARGLDGLLVGDLAQPRGGPMRSGHVSHQTGLDVDIWFLPAPPRPLPPERRETLGATSVVADGGAALDPARWTPAHADVLRTAAAFPEVDRIFVHAAIKRELCAVADGDRAWLRKVRPWWGHHDHFHVRLRCPGADDGLCVDQAPPPGDGCGATLAWWFSDEARAEAERMAEAPPRPRPTLDDLPPRCRAVLAGG